METINQRETYALVTPKGEVLDKFRTKEAARGAIPHWKCRSLEKNISIIKLKDTATETRKKMRRLQNG